MKGSKGIEGKQRVGIEEVMLIRHFEDECTYVPSVSLLDNETAHMTKLSNTIDSIFYLAKASDVTMGLPLRQNLVHQVAKVPYFQKKFTNSP